MLFVRKKDQKFIKQNKLGVVTDYLLLNRYPLILGEYYSVSDIPYIGFYCKFCKKIHKHQFLGNGFRVSHCNNPKSPLFRKSYFLVLLKEFNLLEIMGDHKRYDFKNIKNKYNLDIYFDLYEKLCDGIHFVKKQIIK